MPVTWIECEIIGNAGAPAKLQTGKSGLPYAVFPVAVDGKDKATGQKTVTWVQVSLLGKLAELLAKDIHKGTRLFLKGIPSVYVYKNRSGEAAATLQLKADKCIIEAQPASMDPSSARAGSK